MWQIYLKLTVCRCVIRWRGGENFVNGCMVALGVRLDMDLVLKATGQGKTPAFLLSDFEGVSGRVLVAG